MTETYDLVIIGSGPAGMEAAVTAGEAGLKTLLVDGFPAAGGQYFKALPENFKPSSKTKTEKEGEFLASLLNASKVERVYDALVWGVFQQEDGYLVAIHGPGAPKKALARTLILATGAYDTPVAFPGWTLPGVLTAGAALIFAKTQRVAPGKRAVVGGTGPLLLSIAAHLIDAGVEIAGICEANNLLPKGFLYTFTALNQMGRMEEGAKYMSRILKAGAPYRTGWAVVAAKGREQVEAAVIARVDGNMKPIPGTEKTIEADTIITGYSLTPNTGLARMLGCNMEYQPKKGGWVPVRDETLQTSLAGCYVAGDAAGVGGAELARLEGRMAGLAAAVKTGRMSEKQAGEIYGRLKPDLNAQRRYARMLGELFSVKPGVASLATDDTLLCRCEEITLAEVKKAVAAGARTIGEVKMVTRTGMGNCQGRMCENSVFNAILAELSGEGATAGSVGSYSIRPPLHPLPVDVLAEADQD